MPEYIDEQADIVIPTAIPTPVDFNTATVKLNPKDTELLISNTPIDYTNEENAYLGGEFTTNENDYVEVLIYDTNNNLLESGVVDSSDYYYDEEKRGIKLKTGTILRKMGYDRGRFIVKYNFLRRLAGSHETLIINSDGNIPTSEPYLDNLNKTIFIKENKYLIHEISPTRTELRLIAQNIRDEKYLRDFYRLPRKIKKLRADFTGDSVIEFKGTNKGASTTIGFVNPSGFANPAGRWDEAMIGGKIIIPNVFLRRIIFPELPPTGDDVGTKNTESIVDSLFQASFFISSDEGIEKKNTGGTYGDKKFLQAINRFKDLNDSSTISNTYGITFHGNLRDMNGVKNLSDSLFNVVYYKENNPRPIVIVESNSFIPADVATSYTWEITGFDNDNGKWYRIEPKFDSTAADTGGNIEILSGTGFANPSDTNLLRATQEISPPSTQNTPRTTRSGSKLKFKIYGKDVHVGIKLTVTTNVDNRSSMLHLPAIIETD